MDSHTPDELEDLFQLLTDRQFEVLRHFAAHERPKEIARALGISQHTVRAHADAIRDRLGAASIREAAILLVRHDAQSGLVPNWQCQIEGIALPPVADAALENDEPTLISGDHDAAQPPGVGALPSGDTGTATGDLAGYGGHSFITPSAAASDGSAGGGGHRLAHSAFAWIHTRFKTLSPAKWIALIGVATIVVLFITVGIIAGAAALLQTLQDFSVRSR